MLSLESSDFKKESGVTCHRTERSRSKVRSRASLREWWRIDPSAVARTIWQWRRTRFAKALGQGVILSFLLLFAVLLPFVPNPSDFAIIGTLRYMQAGFLIAAAYIVVSASILGCTKMFQKTRNDRRNITLWLKGARNIAVGGGIAVLASAMAFVPEDQERVFVAWIVLSLFLYLWGYLFLSGAFSPKNLQPITDAELLDAAVYVSTGGGKRSSGKSKTDNSD